MQSWIETNPGLEPEGSRSARNWVEWLTVLSFGVLFAVIVMQQMFALEPCRLCYWQRYPYMIVALLGCIASFLSSQMQRACLVVFLGCFAASLGLAMYHSGVELGMISLPEGCGSVSDATSLEALKAEIFANNRPSCDQISFKWLGLSLSNWNGLLSAGLMVLTSYALVRNRHT